MEIGKFKIGFLSAIVVFVCAGIVQAHPGHGNNGFAGGLAHPFSGIDHLLAMIAVGLWAVQIGGGRPSIFCRRLSSARY